MNALAAPRRGVTVSHELGLERARVVAAARVGSRLLVTVRRAILAVAITGSWVCFVASPSASAQAWRVQSLEQTAALYAVSCPTSSTCVAVGNAGTTYSAANGFRRADAGAKFSAVACPTTSACVAVGERGVVFTSADNGTSWTSRAAGTTEDLKGVACPSSSACFAVGRGGTIRKTSNGGVSWTGLSSGVFADLNAIDCATTTVCWVVGDSGVVLRTIDAGGSWALQGAATTTSLSGISCSTTTACVAVGAGKALATTDAGGLWISTTVETYAEFASVSCSSASKCFAVGWNAYRSSDGGLTWTLTSAQPERTGAHSFTGIDCTSANDCTTVGSSSLYASDGASVNRTTDGGASWAFVNYSPAYDYWAVSCASSLVCITTGGHYASTGNGGASWSTQSSPAAADGKMLGGVSCPTASDCWAVGDSSSVGTTGNIIRTTDGGATWSAQTSGVSSTLYDISCASSTSCVAVGSSGTALTTTNGGSSWTPRTTGSSHTLEGIACASTSVCVAVGESGRVITSSDGGVNWTARSSGTSQIMTAVACPSTSVCIAVGRGSTTLTTANGGLTWTSRSSSGSGLYAVSCSTISDCVGAGYALVETSDGGATWFDVDLEKVGGYWGPGYWGTRALSAVSCRPGGSCWVVGEQGAILSNSGVDGKAPTPPSIDSKPSNPTTSGSPSVAFTGESGASFECKLDGGSFSSCSSPKSYSGLGDDRHTFRVRQTDSAGNTSSVTSHTWLIDTAAPAAPSITSNPADPSSLRSPSFGFSGEAGATFECKLDSGGFTACSSPKTYSGLAEGSHAFQIRQTDAAGTTGPTASYSWLIDATPPAAPTITSKPANATTLTSASFSFNGENGGSFECKIDSDAFGPCGSPKTYSGLVDGSHTFQVRQTDIAGNAGSAATYTWLVDAAATTPVNTALPSISGTPTDGNLLIATDGSWSGSTSFSFSYSWVRCNPEGGDCVDIAETAAKSYRLTSADVDSRVRIRVTASNAAGVASALSALSAVVQGVAPINNGSPMIFGTARSEETLTATSGTWLGSTPMSFSYQWQRCQLECSSIPGAIEQSYTLTAFDAGSSVRVRVMAANLLGSDVADSGLTSEIEPDAPRHLPENREPPTIAGIARDNETLTTNKGRWVGSEPMTYRYQWQRCNSLGGGCGDIAGAVGEQYKATSADIGSTLRILVIATNPLGETPMLSAATQAVASVLPSNISPPQIVGVARVGLRLQGTAGRWEGSDPMTHQYQWQACTSSSCEDRDGASGESYTIRQEDLGLRIRLRVMATNPGGTRSAVSAATETVSG